VDEAEDGCIDQAQILESITEKTAVVCLSMVEYRTGQRYNLKEIANAVHAQGGLLVVDATQALGQVPIDAGELGIDVLVSAGYKWLCGPFGIAIMYLTPALYSRLDPGIVGWRSHEVMWEFRADRLKYPETAARFEAGTMAYGCALGLAKSVTYLNSIGIDEILHHNRAIADRIGEEMAALGGEMASPMAEEERSSIIAIRFPGKDAATISALINAQNVVVSERGGVIRISPHLYNDENDIDKVVEATTKALSTHN
jgi:selenocysteine lyase/cysteine desulfurase